MENADKKVRKDLSKESIITIIHALKFLREDEIFSELTTYIYHSDVDISIEAIKALASASNGLVIPHLFYILDRGKLPQKIEAVRTLSNLNLTSLIDDIIKYFSVFHEIEIKRELLEAVNKLSPNNDQVVDLNFKILMDDNEDEFIKNIAVKGLIRSKNYSFLKQYLPNTSSLIANESFRNLLREEDKEISDLLKHLSKSTESFSSTTLGTYLCLYIIKVQNPNDAYIRDIIQGAEKETIIAFLKILDKELEGLSSYILKRVYKALLLTPWIDLDIEILIGDLLKRLVDIVKYRNLKIGDDLGKIVSVHLDVLIKRVKENHITFKGTTEREKLLHLLLAHLLENYSSSSDILEIQQFFKGEPSVNVTHLVKKLKHLIEEGKDEDKKKLMACIPLFLETDSKKKAQLYAILKDVDPEVPVMLKRVNRFIRVIGWMGIKALSKKIQDMLLYSKQEKFRNLESTCTVTLCQISPKSVVNEVKQVLKNPSSNKDIIYGYIRGVGYLPPETATECLLQVLLDQSHDSRSKLLALEVFHTIDLSNMSYINLELMKAFFTIDDLLLKEKVAEIISLYGDRIIFNRIVNHYKKSNIPTRIIYIKTLTEIAKRYKSLLEDILTHHLYLFLEKGDKQEQIESLLSLLEIGDDYALEIVKERLDSDDEFFISQILHRLPKVSFSKLLHHIFKLVESKNKEIHKTLRDILPDICKPQYLNKVKTILLEYLGTTKAKSAADTSFAEKVHHPKKEGVLLYPKLKFKFEREHSQILTVMFIDIVEYTKWTSRSDAVSLIDLLKAFEEIVISTVESYNGQVVKKLGDGILAVFKHAVNAVVSSIEIQEKVNERNRFTIEDDKFSVRIGLHTGSVIRKEGDVYGEVVNIASRMESAASPGTILITEDVYSEINKYVTCEKYGDVTLRGIEGNVKAYKPGEISSELRKILEMQSSNYESFLSISKNDKLEKLKKEFFSPRFMIPSEYKIHPDTLSRIKEAFTDILQAVEEITNDPHEEYEFKKYLQDRWNEIL